MSSKLKGKLPIDTESINREEKVRIGVSEMENKRELSNVHIPTFPKASVRWKFSGRAWQLMERSGKDSGHHQ